MNNQIVYNLTTEQLKGVALRMAGVVSFTQLMLAFFTVDVLYVVDSWAAFLIILIVGIVVNMLGVGLSTMYVIGILMQVRSESPKEEDDEYEL